MTTRRSSAYLKFIRSLPCCACGGRGPSEAAHGKAAGMALKGDDFEAMPLCAACHREGRRSYHRMGNEEAWAAWWGLDLAAIRKDLRERFEQWRTSR